jgi:hypothetical protein
MASQRRQPRNARQQYVLGMVIGTVVSALYADVIGRVPIMK